MTNEQIIKAFHDENTVFTTVSEDTFRNMPWNSFTELLKSNGFKKGLEYMFWCGAECHEVIYYREDGLIIYAESNRKSQLDQGSIYGELRLNDSNCRYPIGAWTGSVRRNDLVFEIVVENGVFKTLEDLLQHGTLKKQWDHHHFLWFVNHRESKAKDYNFEKITKEKISKLPQECIDILEPERRI